MDFLTLYVRGWLFTILTLGAYYPYFQTQRQAFLSSHTYFGNQRFHFSGHGSGLMVPFAITLFMTYAVVIFCGLTIALHLTNAGLSLLLIPFVLGPAWIWLLGRKQNYFWHHTTFDETRISSAITWQKLFTLYVGNFVLLLVTLGFALPWVTVRMPVFLPAPCRCRGLRILIGFCKRPSPLRSPGKACRISSTPVSIWISSYGAQLDCPLS
jgi:uncharacterized membrane protein YjgN (DUF898 family)